MYALTNILKGRTLLAVFAVIFWGLLLSFLTACGGGGSSSDDGGSTNDTTPPTFAGVGTITPRGATNLDLSWTAAQDDKDDSSRIRYKIYYDTSPHDLANLGTPYYTTNAGVTRYSLNELTPDTVYYILVVAQDTSRNTYIGDSGEQSQTTGTTVSLAEDIQPIFDRSCQGSNCHGISSPNSAELNLSSAQTSYVSLVGTGNGADAYQCTGTNTDLRVDLVNVDNSYLLRKLEGNPMSCITNGFRMPKNANPLPAEKIELIRSWIVDGATNN